MSVVFADLVGFTALSEDLDAEDVARIQDGWFDAARGAVAHQNGQVEKFIGDAVMATFGTVHADDTDPVRAVRAARGMLVATGRLEADLGLRPGTLRLRVGVNTGEVVVTRAGGEGWRVTGDTVNTASRLQSSAEPGQVLLGPETAFGVAHAFVLRPADRLELRGKAEPTPTWEVVEERTRMRRGLGDHGMHAPLLGRAAELAELADALAAARTETGAVVALVAPPGVGKSRLVEELLAGPDGAGTAPRRVLLGDEPHRGYPAVASLLTDAGLAGGDDDASTAEVVRRLRTLGYADEHAAVTARHVADLLAGRPLTAQPDDLWAAWTAVLDTADGALPVWVVEDVHLAGPDLQAFLRHAVTHPPAGGRLLLLTGRPTVGLDAALADLDGSPSWRGVRHLTPLDPPTTRDLLEHLLGRGVLPEEATDGVVAASGGNPLFVEELLRSWIQTGVLRPEPGPADAAPPTGGARPADDEPEGAADGRRTWRFLRDAVPAVPSTVHAIYQGQLDALPGGSRTVVERGSVPGITFPEDALPALGVAEPDPPLGDLTRTGLLVGPHDHAVGRRAYTYRHALLRDTAYGSLSRRDRAELHARFARWLQADPGPALPELVGTHLALAVEVLPATATGLADGTSTTVLAEEAGRALEEAAAGHLVSSPQRSAALLARALALPGGTGAERLARQLALGEAERRSGRLPQAMAAFSAAADAARARDDVDGLVAAALGFEAALFASRLDRTGRRPTPAGVPAAIPGQAPGGYGARSVELLRAAEAALPPESAHRRSAVLAALGQALTYADEPSGPGVARRAVTLAEGDDTALARALLAARAGLTGPAHLAARLADGARATAAAAASGDGELLLEATRLRYLDLLETGDLAAADVVQARATELIRTLGRPLYTWYPPMWEAMRALLAGRHPEAAELTLRFAEAGRRAHYADVGQVEAIQRFQLHIQTGDVAAAMPAVLERSESWPERWAFAPALGYALLGDRERAQAHLDVVTRDDLANVPDDLSAGCVLAYAAQAASRLGDVAAAAALGERLAPWEGHVLVLGSGALCLGYADLHLGLCRLTEGRLPEAARLLRTAAERDDALGAEGFAASARAALSRALALLGDDAAAGAAEQRAWQDAERLGMRTLTTALATEGPSAARAAGQPSPPPSSSPVEHP